MIQPQKQVYLQPAVLSVGVCVCVGVRAHASVLHCEIL